MQIDILTLFPKMFKGTFNESMLKRAQKNNLAAINIHNLRKWAVDKHNTVDDRPYGGGAGMVIMVEPVDRALADLKQKSSHVILMSPQGNRFTQQTAQKLSKHKHLIIICGHYEGFDERIREHLVDEEISLGDFVLTGGEIPTMAIVDATVRLLPGVLGKKESLAEESHTKPGYLEYPHYTRPVEYQGWEVPEVLLSGNHAEIKKWREENSRKTSGILNTSND